MHTEVWDVCTTLFISKRGYHVTFPRQNVEKQKKMHIEDISRENSGAGIIENKSVPSICISQNLS